MSWILLQSAGTLRPRSRWVNGSRERRGRGGLDTSRIEPRYRGPRGGNDRSTRVHVDGGAGVGPRRGRGEPGRGRRRDKTMPRDGVAVAIPMPLQVVIDDVGWWSGEDGSARQEPYRTGIHRRHVPADYRAIVELGRALGIRPQAATVLCEWDTENILRALPESTWMGAEWDNSRWIGPWLEEAADVIRQNEAHYELTIHGLGHEYWTDGRFTRAEWADRGRTDASSGPGGGPPRRLRGDPGPAPAGGAPALLRAHRLPSRVRPDRGPRREHGRGPRGTRGHLHQHPLQLHGERRGGPARCVRARRRRDDRRPGRRPAGLGRHRPGAQRAR